MTPFTFNAAAAAGTSALAGAITGSVTPWYRLSDRTSASSLIISGTFVATVRLEYSNAAAFDKGPDFAQDANVFTEPTLRELPAGIADYVRARCTAYTSGSPVFSFAKALSSTGSPFSIPEDTKKTPAPSSEAS